MICEHLDIGKGDKVEKLREISSDRLLEVITKKLDNVNLFWQETIDGVIIKQSPRLYQNTEIYGDKLFSKLIRETIRALARMEDSVSSSRKVYSYQFNSPLQTTAALNFGIDYMAEVYFIFNLQEYLNKGKQKVSVKTTQFWVNFVSNGVLCEDWEPLSIKSGI
ncbi:hypothetical protein K7432_006059 [Basidiobolus ranarum]|uniref:Uncharacterized protein n=1 Tax=Basidiobolus ranarum TaxID=34480 RepID=A0ABR2WVI4_9FUNG